MRNTGLLVLLATFGLVGLLIILWLAGFIFGVGGNLIHLSLVLAMADSTHRWNRRHRPFDYRDCAAQPAAINAGWWPSVQEEGNRKSACDLKLTFLGYHKLLSLW
jgi:hypothetical protein